MTELKLIWTILKIFYLLPKLFVIKGNSFCFSSTFLTLLINFWIKKNIIKCESFFFIFCLFYQICQHQRHASLPLSLTRNPATAHRICTRTAVYEIDTRRFFLFLFPPISKVLISMSFKQIYFSFQRLKFLFLSQNILGLNNKPCVPMENPFTIFPKNAWQFTDIKRKHIWRESYPTFGKDMT